MNKTFHGRRKESGSLASHRAACAATLLIALLVSCLAPAWAAEGPPVAGLKPTLSSETGTVPPAPDRPPVQVSYDMPMDGFVALDIHDKLTGKLVRRLVGETFRKQGPVTEDWDLKDNSGQPVQPGAYTWKAAARPPFKLTYETSVYNAGIPAWFAPPPAKGGGSWLADHTMASHIAAQKDHLWITAPCAESGNAMIATDLDGVKEWGAGMGAFGFDGPFKVAADERCAYAVTRNMICRVDPTRQFALRSIFAIPTSTPSLPWPVSGTPQEGRGGLAAREGKLYLSVRADSSLLRSSFIADAVDPARCQPLVSLFKGHGRRTGRNDKNYEFNAYDELMLLYATFQCERMPAVTPSYPNFDLNSTTEASLGPAPSSGPYRGSVVLAFNEPVIVSSVTVPDGAIQVMAMKPGRVMPANTAAAAAGAADMGSVDNGDPASDALFQDFKDDTGMGEDWISLPITTAPGRPAIALAPAGGMRTAALRFKVKRLAYALVMSHRFEDVAPKGKWLFREGAANRSGGWEVDRKQTAITESTPATAALVWTGPQQLRGLSFVQLPAGQEKAHCRLAIDTWVGARDPDPLTALEAADSWRELRIVDYAYNPMLYQVDFGGIVETAGVRIRVLEVPAREGGFRAGFASLVAYHPVGGDPTNLPPDLSQRVTELRLPSADDDKQKAEIVRHLPMPNAGDLAFDARGTLHCISGREVVTVPLGEGEKSRVVISRDKLDAPLALAFGPDGLLYVTDNGPKIIKVFKPETGEPVRTLGSPGGLKWGKWDPSRLNCPSGLALDSLGRAWVTDWCSTPKRIQRFSADGKPEKEFLGPTQYGGGGTMDSRDRRFIYYCGMKFVINWDDYSWKLDSRLGPIYVDRTVYWNDKRYLVGPSLSGGLLVTIAEEKDDVEKLMAQAGLLKGWGAIKDQPEIRARFGGLDLARTFFVWSDLNGDRQPQVDEVQVVEMENSGNWTVGEDLTLVGGGGVRLRTSGIRPDGVPVYDLKKIEPYNLANPPGHSDKPWGDDKGRIFTTGAKLIDSDGKTILWQYYNEYNRHDGFYMTPFGHDRPPGVLNWEQNPIGHIKVNNAQGVEEDYYISNSDAGDWFCFSADGMLVGCLIGGPAGYGRSWPAEWEHGKTDVSDLRPGQEHYQGCVVKTDDGHVYAIVGHNHISVVRVEGLEKLQRLNGGFSVSAEQAEQTRLWQARELVRRQAAQAPKIGMMLRSGGSPDVSGSIEDWPDALFVTISETIKRNLAGVETNLDAIGALAYDAQNLYVAMRVLDKTPLKNSAQDLLTLFKNGDAAEVTLAMDTNAPAARSDPAAGDLRLLFALVKGSAASPGGQPVAVLYRPVDPAAPLERHHEFSSPVGRVSFDRAEPIPGAKVAFKTQQIKDGTYWVMEAAVPWAAIGVQPPPAGAVLKGDLGYLQSDDSGLQTVGRKYWSGKGQTVISDLPSEARLNPSLWGRFRAVKQDKELRITVARGVDEMGLNKEAGDVDVDAFLEGDK